MLKFIMKFVLWLVGLFVWKKGYEQLSLPSASSIFDIQVNSLQGKPFDLSYLKYKKLIMIMNVASE